MRMLKKNKQELHYALQTGEAPVYKLDSNGNKIVDFVDEHGTEYYRETGEMELIYSTPVPFSGNIAMSGDEVKVQEYGLSEEDYDAVLIVSKGELPLVKTSLIWHESEIGYKDTGKKIPDPNTADYRVRKKTPSLNQEKYLLKKIVK